jgi:hypothetical protein
MKKTLVLLACLLALALAATAQQQINFADLPLVGTPAPIPAGYGRLNWGNFWYVNPSQYPGAGPGYQNLFTHRDIAFIGGQFCGPVKPGCYGVITSPGAFVAVSALVAGGYKGNLITVLAYNNGSFVGSARYNLSTRPQVMNFPQAWGFITEMQIQTDEPGDLVLFDLSLYPIVFDPSGH